MTSLKPGDEVRVFDRNGKRMGQPPGGWYGEVVKVGRPHLRCRLAAAEMATEARSERPLGLADVSGRIVAWVNEGVDGTGLGWCAHRDSSLGAGIPSRSTAARRARRCTERRRDTRRGGER